MTWELDFRGGDEVLDHPVPGTRRFTVDGRVETSKNPPRELARVADLEVIVNRNGVFEDKEDLHRQVSDASLRRSFIVEIRRWLGKA